jgi:hypothetical protein
METTGVVGATVVVPMVLMSSPGNPREVAARQRENDEGENLAVLAPTSSKALTLSVIS